MIRWVSATGSRPGADVADVTNRWTPSTEPSMPRRRLAAGIDQHAGAGAIGRPDVARAIGDADGGDQPARSDDFAHDDGLIQIAARRGQQDGVAGGEMGFVEPVAEPARRGGADRAADRQCRPAVAGAVEDRRWRSATMSCSARNTGLSSRPRPPAATGPCRRGCRRRTTRMKKHGDRQTAAACCRRQRGGRAAGWSAAHARRCYPKGRSATFGSGFLVADDHRQTTGSSRQSRSVRRTSGSVSVEPVYRLYRGGICRQCRR